MKWLLLASTLISSSALADELPTSMMGAWTMGDEEGIMDRAVNDPSDFIVEKHRYLTVDFVCIITHIKKLSENDYIVQSRCEYDGGDDKIPPSINVSEFEMKGKRLRVTPATGS